MSKSLARDDQQPSASPPSRNRSPASSTLSVNSSRPPARRLKPSSASGRRRWLRGRSSHARLPVVSSLQGLSRYAAPGTRALVEAIAALAGDLDWRQTYTSADFGQRFLDNYGWSEWIGERGAFVSDAIACGVLLLGPDIEYPAHSHEAEELYLPLAGQRLVAFRQIRLAASRAGDMDPSSLLDDPRHAHRARAPARGLRLARGRSQREVSHREVNGAHGGRRKQASRAVEWPTRTSPSDIPLVRSKSS